MKSDYPVDRLVAQAQRSLDANDREAAIKAYCEALRLVNRYPPAKVGLDAIAKEIFAEAITLRDRGNLEGAITHLVRSRSLNPDSEEVHDELVRLISLQPQGPDLTTDCMILPDASRADTIYRDAIRTCLEFVAYGGIVGEIFEFGVLAGWTARLIAETMLELHYPSDLYLFDSFEGLPRDKNEIDAASPDVRRGIWREEMDISAKERQINQRVDVHVHRVLSRIISGERIKVFRGYFSETLRKPLQCKAALIHLDCDLYSSTRDVLDGLTRHQVLQDGTVLMFDDWNCHRANPKFGQRRAFAEFLHEHKNQYTASEFMRYGFNSMAFILHQDGAS